ncbi:MAG: PilZ domain-containing protein [Terriglobales bacterium]
MSVPASEEDRRRHRRIACGGEASISLLPSDGALYFGHLRDLSQGGMSVEMPCPLGMGARAELVVRINGLTFRTLGLVKAMGPLRTGVEFLHLTATGRQMLEEFLADLEEKQKAMATVRSGRVGSEVELSRQLKSAGIRPPLLDRHIPQFGSPGKTDPAERGSQHEKVIESVEALVRVDVFG